MTTKSTDKVATSASGARVTTTLEEANEVGFLGREVDPTPDENYSLQTPADAPTPETDADAFATAQKAAGLGARDKFRETKGGAS